LTECVERLTWSSLNCDEKKSYLSDGKDLTASHLFYWNQNEQFYREYVVDCTDSMENWN